ncbi:MAG: PilZ domain-containing protein [Gammaproteobacteria bacterium]|nr:PilZ domain-containing protein [Gammaproteobacteria bacterium]
MDNRWSERAAIKFGVALQYGPLGLIMGKTRDISADGMFVQTGRVLVYRNDIVSVSFAYPLGENRRIINARATVRHTKEDGIGLLFENFKFDALAFTESHLLIPAYH